MKNPILVIILLFSVLIPFNSSGQEIAVTFATESQSHSELLALPEGVQSFLNRQALLAKVDEEIKRLQLKGYISTWASEREIADEQGLPVLEVIFNLGQQWKNLVIAFPKSVELYLQKSPWLKLLEPAPDSLLQTHYADSTTFLKKNHSLRKLKIPIDKVPAFMNQLSQSLAQEYSPFSKIKLVNIEALEFPDISVTLDVLLIPQRTVDSLVVKGYPNVDYGLLKHRGGLKLPLAFSEKTIQKAEENLSTSPYLSIQRPSEVLFEDKRTTLYMYLQKKETNQLEGILGFGSDPENQSIQLNGYLNLQLWNNFNKSEQFNLNYKADGNQQERLEISASLPYIRQSPFGIHTSFELFRRDSTFTTASTRGQITYKPLGPLEIALGYTSIKSTTGPASDGIQNNIADFQQGLWGLEAKIEQPKNSILMPTNYRLTLQYAYGSSEENSLSGSSSVAMKNRFPRQRTSIELEYLWDLWVNHYFYIHHNSRWINGENLRINELHRFGGTQSLRGFNENLLETAQLHLIQTEYRLAFSDAFYIHHLTDLAFYRDQIDEQMTTNYSLGLGIATMTRAGLLKLQIAQGFGKRSDFSSNNTKIHLVFNSQF